MAFTAYTFYVVLLVCMLMSLGVFNAMGLELTFTLLQDTCWSVYAFYFHFGITGGWLPKWVRMVATVCAVLNFFALVLTGATTMPIMPYIHGGAIPFFSCVCSVFLVDKMPCKLSQACTGNWSHTLAWAVLGLTLPVFWAGAACMTIALPLDIDLHQGDPDGRVYPVLDEFAQWGYFSFGMFLPCALSSIGVLTAAVWPEKRKGSVLFCVKKPPEGALLFVKSENP